MNQNHDDLRDVSSRLAAAERRYYGKYRGTVANNQDPDRRGRLQLKVPALLGNEITRWALPCLPFGGATDVGTYFVPERDARVWVEFEQGDISYPVWTGTYWTGGDNPPADLPFKRTLATPTGHILEFDDTPGVETVSLIHGGAGNPSVVLDSQGGVTINDANGAKLAFDTVASEVVLQDAAGNSLTMTATSTTVADVSGNSVKLDASGATVKATKIVLDAAAVMLGGAGGEPILKGQSFLQFFMTHVHPTSMGPSGPPVPQGELSSLSTTVLTK